jgi:UDP-GlcNAc:undecaprenyl-phosphate GlcNAc-1-phosphate transferase
MNFPINVYILAFSGAALISAVTLPLWRRWAISSGLVDDPGHRKIHSAPIPLSGGFTVLTGLALPILFGALLLFLNRSNSDTFELLRYGIGKRAPELSAIVLGAIGMLLLGWIDDKHELRAGLKFAGQFLIALLVSIAGVRITLFVPNIFFSYAITVLWILTVTNAFNFIDNMNGLCGGTGLIAAWFFGLNAAVAGQYLVAILAFVTSGALLGFLPGNFPKAKVFLGDAGSHLVGFLCAVLAILPHFYTKHHPQTLAVFKPLLILAIPLADLCFVVILRWRLGKPFYIGDNNHFSHQLVRRGWSRAKAVLIIWLAAVLSGCLSLL